MKNTNQPSIVTDFSKSVCDPQKFCDVRSNLPSFAPPPINVREKKPQCTKNPPAIVTDNSKSVSAKMNLCNVSSNLPPPPPPPNISREKKSQLTKNTNPLSVVTDNSKSVSDPPKLCHVSANLPPPPPPPNISREKKPQSTKNASPPMIVNDNSKSVSDQQNLSEVSSNFNFPTGVFIETTDSQHSEMCQMITKYEPPKICIADESDDRCTDQNLEYRNENVSGRSSPMPGQRPPIFFTYEDFESVMRHSGMSDKSVNEQYESIVTPETSAPNSISSFVESSMMNAEEEDQDQACFRVTTGNVPFEKCVGSFTFSIDNTDFDEKFDEPDHYIFEDYMDRSKRWNARPTRLFDDDTFDNFGKDDGAGSIRRTATKVRFVIESPSSSIPDPDLDNTFDSLGNIESLIIDDRTINESHRTSVIITEITETNQPIEGDDNLGDSPKSDQFGDVPFSSILDGDINNTRNLNSGQNFNVDGPKISEQMIVNNKEEAVDHDEAKIAEWSESMERKNKENHRIIRSTHSPRVMNSKKPNLDSIPNIDEDLMPELPITYDPRDEGFVRKDWDNNTDFFNDEVLAVDVSLNDDNFETHSTIQTESSCRTSSEMTKAARKAFVGGKLKADSNENLNSAIEDSIKTEIPDKPKPLLKKIFIDSALRDFIDNDDDLEWNDSSEDEEDKFSIKAANDNDLNCNENLQNVDKSLFQEVPLGAKSNDNENNNEEASNKELNTDCGFLQGNLINGLTLSRESKDEENWVPVSVRRNSFLSNMLTSSKTSSLSENVPCSIIAAHPKPTLQPRVTAEAAAVALSSPVANISREVVAEGTTSVFRNVDKSSGEAGTIELVRSGSNELSQNQLGNGTGVKVVGSKPETRERIASRSEVEKKSTGEAKSDVLSELLCNFGAIKLKSVEPHKREIDWAVADDKPAIEQEIEDKREKEKEEEEEEKEEVTLVGRNRTEHHPRLQISCNQTKVEGSVVDAENSRPTRVSMTKTSTTTATTTTKTSSPRTTKQLDIQDSSMKDSGNRASEKTDHHIMPRGIDDKSTICTFECPNGERLRRNEKTADSIILDTSIITSADCYDHNQQVISVDKCAIARKNNSSTRCNNYDNNAMTPVALSNDQKSSETYVTITPGSVRNFVELYEIQRDQTSKNSKSNYSEPVAKRSTYKGPKGFNYPEGDDHQMQVSLGDKNVQLIKSTYGEENEICDGNKMKNQIKRQDRDEKQVSLGDNNIKLIKSTYGDENETCDGNKLKNQIKGQDRDEKQVSWGDNNIKSIKSTYGNENETCEGYKMKNQIKGHDEKQVSLGDKNVKLIKSTYENENETCDGNKVKNQIRGRDYDENQVSLGDKNLKVLKGNENQAEKDDIPYNVITRNVVQNGITKYGLLSMNDSTNVQNKNLLSSSGPVPAKRRSLEFSLNTNTDNSHKNETKKSVSFYSDCKVIEEDYDEAARIKTKRRAPERPLRSEERDCATKSIVQHEFEGKTTANKFITDTINPTPTPRSDFNLIRTQIQPGVEDSAKDTIKSGTAPSVPKSDVSHPRQPYVFLCRV